MIKPVKPVKLLQLCEGSWLISTIHSLVSSLSSKSVHIFRRCKLMYSASLSVPTSRLKLDKLQMQTSLDIETLVTLLSHLEVEDLSFHDLCQVGGIEAYKPSSKVRQIV